MANLRLRRKENTTPESPTPARALTRRQRLVHVDRRARGARGGAAVDGSPRLGHRQRHRHWQLCCCCGSGGRSGERSSGGAIRAGGGAAARRARFGAIRAAAAAAAAATALGVTHALRHQTCSFIRLLSRGAAKRAMYAAAKRSVAQRNAARAARGVMRAPSTSPRSAAQRLAAPHPVPLIRTTVSQHLHTIELAAYSEGKCENARCDQERSGLPCFRLQGLLPLIRTMNALDRADI